MKKPLALLFLTVALYGCGPRPEPQVLPVLAEARDLSILVGEWWGEYTSVDTGRSGQIRFVLEAQSDLARGDVLMFPAHWQPEGGPPTISREPLGGSTLAIEFVRLRSEDETVTGTLERYEDPSCACMVVTTFVGRVSTNRITGTFETKGGPGYQATMGRWRVDRKNN